MLAAYLFPSMFSPTSPSFIPLSFVFYSHSLFFGVAGLDSIEESSIHFHFPTSHPKMLTIVLCVLLCFIVYVHDGVGCCDAVLSCIAIPAGVPVQFSSSTIRLYESWDILQTQIRTLHSICQTHASKY